MRKTFSIHTLILLLGLVLLTTTSALSQDSDGDGILDDADNCTVMPNGPNLGTCAKEMSGVVISTGITCSSDDDCGSEGICQKNQEDFDENGIGDVCECYADCDCNKKIDLSDLVLEKHEFLRTDCTSDYCYADSNKDGKVDLADLVIMKAQFLRADCAACARPVGVIYILHGGMDTYKDQYLWDAAVHQFTFDPNHPVFQLVIWNPGLWSMVLDSEFSLKFIGKYEFEYERIGGTDPFHSISDTQLTDMKTELDNNPYGLRFEVDFASWMSGDRPDHYPYPRFLYYGPDGPGVGENCTYCGENEPGGPWEGCDPHRYDVDGPAERLLKKGVTQILMIDTTVGGVRFYKSYDVVQMTKRLLHEWNNEHGSSIPLTWINDYSDLMERSYPTAPAGWTPILGEPAVDQHVLVNGSPNPVAADYDLALLHAEGIEAAMSAAVTDAETGVILFNHGLFDPERRFFDPKIDDTVVLNENIKALLLQRHPDMDPDNIVGAYGGIKEVNPENDLMERTRPMRGEDLAHSYLHEGDQDMPGGEWGYRYWEAQEYLKNRGVQHIAIGFPQVASDSVLTLIELYNQLGSGIGIKTWYKWGTWDYTNYPSVGHPFADYWGNWVIPDCGEWDLNYDGGTSAFTGAATVTGNNSNAKGIIKWITGDASSGTLTLKEVSGTFENDEIITDGKGGSASVNGLAIITSLPECCFEMGGCGDPLRPYPPPRQTPLNKPRDDMDPSLAYALSEYGHLGYDPLIGPTDPNNPVQNQYSGTWELYRPPSDDIRLGQLLAKHVLNALTKPMVYITNGEIESIMAGGTVTFEAHVKGGEPGFTYAWFSNKDDAGWVPVGVDNDTWTWTPGSGEEGIYAIKCVVTDSNSNTGNVIWEGFTVSSS